MKLYCLDIPKPVEMNIATESGSRLLRVLRNLAISQKMAGWNSDSIMHTFYLSDSNSF